MKRFVTYTLLIAVFFAFNYKAINYLLTSSGKATCFVADMDCEEEETETEKSEKKEKKELSEYLFDSKPFPLSINYQSGVNLHPPSGFISSGHSSSVFMPPEPAFI